MTDSLDELLVELAFERLKELILTIYKTVESDAEMGKFLSKAQAVGLPAKASSLNGLGSKKSANLSKDLSLMIFDTSPRKSLSTWMPKSENMTLGSNGAISSPRLFPTLKTNTRNSEGQVNIHTPK